MSKTVQFYESEYPFAELAERGIEQAKARLLVGDICDPPGAWTDWPQHVWEVVGGAYVDGLMHHVWADGKTPDELFKDKGES